MATNPNSLVSRLFKACYFPRSDFWNAPAPIRPSSCWKSIIEAKDLLSNRAQWKIGNGMLVDAWEDPWLPRPRDFRLIGRHSTRLSKVSEFITPNRYWDVKLLEEHFEVADVTLILTIPLNHHSCSDKLIWLYDSKGRFSIKSAYQLARQLLHEAGSTSSIENSVPLWKYIWFS